MWHRIVAQSLIGLLLGSVLALTGAAPSYASVEENFLNHHALSISYYHTCGQYWPSKGVFQTGVTDSGFEANWEFELTEGELRSLNCVRNTFNTQYLELDFRLYGFDGVDDWDGYVITGSNLPGAVHDVGWMDTAREASPGLTNIYIAQLEMGERYHASIAWSNQSGIHRAAGISPRVSFEWVPSRWRDAFKLFCRGIICLPETACDVPYAASGLNPAWCIFSDVRVFVSGGYYDFAYEPNSGGDGIPFNGRVSLDFPKPAATPANPPPSQGTSGPDLFLVKTRNTDPAHGRIEVHTALPGFGYGDGTHAVTRFGTNEQNSGWFQMVGRDLWYIKTKNTGSGRVELHSATYASGYQSGESHATYISTADQDNGWFQMVGLELFFIKTKNTGAGRVEVHSATRGSGYQSGQHNASWIPASDHSNGWFQMLGADLFFVKTKNTGSGRVEIHVAWASGNYQAQDHSVTRFGTNEQDNGWFQIIHRDLWFIKTRNVGSGRVEIHSATEASGYQAGQSNATWLSPQDQSNGWFQVGIK